MARTSAWYLDLRSSEIPLHFSPMIFPMSANDASGFSARTLSRLAFESGHALAQIGRSSNARAQRAVYARSAAATTRWAASHGLLSDHTLATVLASHPPRRPGLPHHHHRTLLRHACPHHAAQRCAALHCRSGSGGGRSSSVQSMKAERGRFSAGFSLPAFFFPLDAVFDARSCARPRSRQRVAVGS